MYGSRRNQWRKQKAQARRFLFLFLITNLFLILFVYSSFRLFPACAHSLLHLTWTLNWGAEIRNVLSKYAAGRLPDPPPLPQRTAYGEVTMKAMGSLFDVLKVVSTPPGGMKLEWPMPMEQLRQVIVIYLELLFLFASTVKKVHRVRSSTNAFASEGNYVDRSCSVSCWNW